MDELFCTNHNKNNTEESQNKKRILKAINLIDDFVSKFISKIEYYKMTLESQLNQTQLNLVNSPLLPNNNKDEQININNKLPTDINSSDNKSPQLLLNKDNDNEYLTKFINSKSFYKKTLYLLFLITEDKSQIKNNRKRFGK